ncbi:MAG: hypothetical protein JXB39_09415 [Deltaproteobacteria bacterium]|nr:hypothetical protein [Deltaproteobacteria bacterium]
MSRAPLLPGFVLLAALAGSSPALAGARVAISDDTWAQVGLLLQPQVRFDQDGTYTKDGWAYTPFLRRARVLLSGQVTDRVYFFFETDSPNMGRSGDWTPMVFVQDAWVEYDVAPELQIDVGMLLLPFSRHGTQGATSLLMSDYHSALLKYPAGSHKIWRDSGVMARGRIAKQVEYRLALTNGVQSGYGAQLQDTDEDGIPDTDPRGLLNPSDLPRVTGRLVYNVFDAEGGPGAAGYFYKGAGLKTDGKRVVTPKRVLSVGLSADWQADAFYAVDPHDLTDPLDDRWSTEAYLGLAADVYADLPLEGGERAVNAQAAFYRYDHGDASVLVDSARGAIQPMSGMGGFVEGGYRIGTWEPLLCAEMYDVSDAEASDYLAILGGLAWWYQGHAANVKAEIGASRAGGSESDFSLAGTLQTQLLF